MPDDVKPPRRYRSDRRQEAAEETRRRVLDAAAALFRDRGYDGASIVAIADAAGVAPETVYARFGNKRTLLGELVLRAVRGDEAAPVPEQAGPRSIAAERDQHRQLRMFAADIVPRLERAAPLVALVAGAARSEPDLADLLTTLHRHRAANLRTLVDAVAANGPLRLSADDAVDTVWALTSPELHQLLTHVSGWTRSRYRNWLADSLTALLLESGASKAPPPRSPQRP